jgi:hypothetical protein
MMLRMEELSAIMNVRSETKYCLSFISSTRNLATLVVPVQICAVPNRCVEFCIEMSA